MLDALKSLDLTALPEGLQDVVLAAQKQALALSGQNAALASQNAELEAVNARLEHMVRELNQLVYGKRSEKLTEDERQLAFEDLERFMTRTVPPLPQRACAGLLSSTKSKPRSEANPWQTAKRPARN